VVLLVAGLMLWSRRRVPSPVPASAPATGFSAERAMDTSRPSRRRPGSSARPTTGSHARYLIARLRALGLEPQLQRTAVVNRFSSELDPSAGTVTNVLAGCRTPRAPAPSS
jgi:hypothetical protein